MAERTEKKGMLFGRFVKVSQEARTIQAKREGEKDSVYYIVYLTDGVKTFDITCGEKNDILIAPAMQWLDIGFDIESRKVKVVSVTAVDSGGSATPGKSSQSPGK